MRPMNPMSDMNPVNRLWLLRHAMVEGAPGLCYGASDLVAQAPDGLGMSCRSLSGA